MDPPPVSSSARSRTCRSRNMPRPSIALTSSQSSAVASTTDASVFVLRYRTGEADDGMSGKEGTFLICSFWLASALAIIGEEQRAVT
jgi:GH15 family glucan-1,4-alpha-glucosidase